MVREGHRTKKKRGLLLSVKARVQFFFCLGLLLSLRRVKRTGRLRGGGQTDSISPPEMDGGRRDGGASTQGGGRQERVA